MTRAAALRVVIAPDTRSLFSSPFFFLFSFYLPLSHSADHGLSRLRARASRPASAPAMFKKGGQRPSLLPGAGGGPAPTEGTVQKDWDQRDFTQGIQLGVTQLVAFVNDFGASASPPATHPPCALIAYAPCFWQRAARAGSSQSCTADWQRWSGEWSSSRPHCSP